MKLGMDDYVRGPTLMTTLMPLALRGSSPLFFLKKTGDLFYSSLSFVLISLGTCHPLDGVTPHLFLPVRFRLSTILCKFVHNFFPSGVTALEGVTRGGLPPLPGGAPGYAYSRTLGNIGRI